MERTTHCLSLNQPFGEKVQFWSKHFPFTACDCFPLQLLCLRLQFLLDEIKLKVHSKCWCDSVLSPLGKHAALVSCSVHLMSVYPQKALKPSSVPMTSKNVLYPISVWCSPSYLPFFFSESFLKLPLSHPALSFWVCVPTWGRQHSSWVTLHGLIWVLYGLGKYLNLC